MFKGLFYPYEEKFWTKHDMPDKHNVLELV